MKIQGASVACALVLCGGTPVAFATQFQAVVASMNVLFANAEGTILRVDLDKKSFTLKTGEETIELSVSNKTVFTLDGKESSMSDALKAGRTATVAHSGGAASRVDVKSS